MFEPETVSLMWPLYSPRRAKHVPACQGCMTWVCVREQERTRFLGDERDRSRRHVAHLDADGASGRPAPGDNHGGHEKEQRRASDPHPLKPLLCAADHHVVPRRARMSLAPCIRVGRVASTAHQRVSRTGTGSPSFTSSTARSPRGATSSTAAVRMAPTAEHAAKNG